MGTQKTNMGPQKRENGQHVQPNNNFGTNCTSKHSSGIHDNTWHAPVLVVELVRHLCVKLVCVSVSVSDARKMNIRAMFYVVYVS